ncbi:MAG: cell division protein FtsL [Deltaproteobacteria bacterium]|nr:MAG: cell division protein FtsL [Deltaproteobacteria bacterium]
MRLFHFILIMLFLFLLAGISHVWLNFKRTQMGYTLSQLKKEIRQIEEYNRKLKLEIAYLRSPEHLEKRALREFGLIHPLPKQIIFLP